MTTLSFLMEWLLQFLPPRLAHHSGPSLVFMSVMLKRRAYENSILLEERGQVEGGTCIIFLYLHSIFVNALGSCLKPAT